MQDEKTEIRVDRERCAGSGLCLAQLPAVFDQSDDDGKVLLRTAVPAPEEVRAVRAAAARCPSGAITLHGGGSGNGGGGEGGAVR
ncbi:ferredoxin [Streptomyces sp. NPDC050658]|uniref:ferredoxin n=1 Tax=unclassified Streptomyces TaxID=2593676 RepID=UPI0034138693